MSFVVGGVVYCIAQNLTHGAETWHERLGDSLTTGAACGGAIAVFLSAVPGRLQRIVLAILGSLVVGGAVRVATNVASSGASWYAGLGEVAHVALSVGFGLALLSLFTPPRGRRWAKTA